MVVFSDIRAEPFRTFGAVSTWSWIYQTAVNPWSFRVAPPKRTLDGEDGGKLCAAADVAFFAAIENPEPNLRSFLRETAELAHIRRRLYD